MKLKKIISFGILLMSLSAVSCNIGKNTAEIDYVKDIDDKSAVENAVVANTTSKENGAELNQWVKLNEYSGKDQQYHNIYLRVTKVTTETENAEYVEDSVKLHNKVVDKDKQINIKNPKLSDEGEWCVMDYEIYIPDDFPAYDNKIMPSNPSFDVSDLGDSADGASSFISFGLGTQKDLLVAEEPEKVEIGKVYSYRFLYAMAKGNEGYCFTHTNTPDGTKYSDENVEYEDVYYKSK